MKGGVRPLGYTIIEVMIVLAISGVMFLIATIFINGKQQRAAFTQGINELASRIQATIEAVADGQYSDVPFVCQAPAVPPPSPLSISPVGATQTQGQNSQCVFLGQFYHFDESSDPTAYEVFSLAGANLDPVSGKPVTNLANAYPTPIKDNQTGGSFDLTNQQSIPQGLQFTGERIFTSPGVSTNGFYGFGFVQGLGSLDASGNSYNSGAQTMALAYAPTLTTSLNEANAIGRVVNGLTYAQAVNVCFTDGTEQATIAIGTNNSQLSTDVQVGVNGC